jgi:alanine racemase
MRTRYSRGKRLGDDDPEIPPRIIAELSATALRNNYDAISRQVPGHSLIPMVKANAYGHGLEWASRNLLDMRSLYALGVATLEEGAELRSALGPRARKTRITVFSGAAPWSDEKGQFCEAHGLTPVIASDEDWARFLKGKWLTRIEYDLKFNTGMNRLGLSAGMASRVAKDLRTLPGDAHPGCVHSHLAMAEKPDAPLSLRQRDRFSALRSELGAAMPATQFSLANSSAIWSAKHFRLEETDIVRPGVSLYGIPPWKGAPARGIEPVLKLKARVIAQHQLRPGESIGYGASFTAPTASKGREAESVCAAVLSAGYGDGVLRSLSNRGHVWIGGQASRFIGIVSMDISAVRSFPSVKTGDWAEILGPNVDIWAQAEEAQTIPYELLTSLTSRVQREYV